MTAKDFNCQATAQVRQPDLTALTDWAEWNAAGRPHVFWGPHPKVRSVSAYLRGIKSGHYRGNIRAELRRRLGGQWRGMNRRIREYLHDSIFMIEDELESQNGGQPDHPMVVQMRIARNLVMDDLGWNEEAGP